jgi:choline dehydrogenase-like flavoprotein
MTYIIGSGLAAAAAAVALVRRGLRPTILDSGLSPDPEALSLKARMASTDPEDWKSEDLAQLLQIGSSATNGIPRKLYFGSDFTFSDIHLAARLNLNRASVYRSFAAGGFSNVWGGVIQTLSEKEFQDWPVTSAEMDRHYSAVRALLFGAQEKSPGESNIRELTSVSGLRPSAQAQALHADLASRHQDLARHGIRFEYPALAVRSQDENGDKGCRYCAMCLYGCPYDCKYTSMQTLARLIRDGSVQYVPGVVVGTIVHETGSIRINGRSLAGGDSRIFTARRVFLGAGLLETSRIILTSLGLFDTQFRVQHSDIFTIPLVRYRADRNVLDEKLHTLCQLVAEIDDETISPHPVHLQFYGYNQLYLRLLIQRAGWLSPFCRPALRALVTRLFVVFGYLHSSVSSSLILRLRDTSDPQLLVHGRPNPLARRISRQIARRLFYNRGILRAVPIQSQLRLDLPGGGYHSGGIFPMQRIANPLQTDRWGSMTSLPGVHIIDASILPEIPAGTTAFTVMANAHRIASECRIDDAE